MSDRTIRYLNGDFDYEGGSLIFSCTKIELELHPGENADGVISVTEQSGKTITGKCYSSEIRMECQTEEFSGTNPELAYHFHTDKMEPGEVVKGEFYIVSDMGEYTIPYVVSILHESLESTLGSIKNLFHFTNLARSNWDEAVRIFYQPEFISILNGNDHKYRNLYRGLVNSIDKNHSLEEFLLGINKKQKIEYHLDKEQIKLENPIEVVANTIKIDRNGWGYTCLQARTEGIFLSLEKTCFTEDDFLGNACHCTFYVTESALHEGKNYGRIIFTHAYGEFEAVITVYENRTGRRNLISRKSKSMVYALTRHYLDFRMKKITMSKWLLLTQELIDHRKSMEEEKVENFLFEAQLLITQERFNEAKWILDHQVPEPEKLEDTLYCYYLYLTTLYNVDEYYTRETARRVSSIYEKNADNWRIAWLLLYLSRELNGSKAQKVAFALRQVEMGCHSPVFYLELLNLYNAVPSLLNRLGRAEKAVLLFGAKHQNLSADLMQQVTYLAVRLKEYDPGLYHILQLIYRRTPDTDTLQAICVLLMKGNKTGTDYFEWYERAVMENLPITRLYEYYMLSMDTSRELEIPKRVLMYFSYQSELPVKQNAYLYAYVVKNKEKYAELYDIYFPQMSRYLIKQLYAEKINENLAYLYQEIVLKQMFTPDNAAAFAKLLLVHCIRVADKKMTRLILLDERLKQEISYPISNGKTYVKLFGSDYTILLEDEKGSRYYGTREYSTERFFLPRKLLSLVEPYAGHSISFDLFVCEGSSDYLVITGQNVERCRHLEQSEVILENYGQILRMHLLSYYFEQDEIEKLDAMLEALTPDQIMYRDRKELLRLLAIRRFYQKAFSLILYYGADNIDAKTVARVCSAILEEDGLIENAQMTYAIHSAFTRGKYNETILQYLMRFYRGTAKNLRDIWKAAMNFDLDTYDICEKMILQTLETGAYIGEEKQIFLQYVAGGAKTEVELAYLSYCAYEYMAHDRVTDELIIREIERVYHWNQDISDVCMLAYLKFFEKQTDKLEEESKQTVREFIHILNVKKHITMPFFQAYHDISADAAELLDMTMVEYHGNPDSTVMIHYIMLGEAAEQNGYKKEEMKNMYAGTFVKSFLLFFGETLQYYITEEYANKEQLTESGTIQKSDVSDDGSQDRYSLINDIAIAETLKDYQTTKNLLTEYEYQKFLTEKLFSPQ